MCSYRDIVRAELSDGDEDQKPSTTKRIGPYRGIKITGAPGVDPSTYTYVAANGRLYEIVCPEREDNVKVCETLLKSISFSPTIRFPEGLGLKSAEDALYDEPPLYLEPPMPKGPAIEPFDDAAVSPGLEPMAAPGCVDWPTSKFLQTPWASTANGDSGWPQGWSRAGPSYYGEGLHQYCNRTNGLNDYHALDFRLKTWDIVYPLRRAEDIRRLDRRWLCQPGPGRHCGPGWWILEHGCPPAKH